MTSTIENVSTGSSQRALTFTLHFHIASPINVKEDLFKQQWTDHEVATGLDKHDQKLRLATFSLAMGNDCLHIFLNLKLIPEEQQDIHQGTRSLL